MAPEKCMFLEAQQPCVYAGALGEVPQYGSKEIVLQDCENRAHK